MPVNFSWSCFFFLSNISCNPVLAFLFFDFFGPSDVEAVSLSTRAGCVTDVISGDWVRATDCVFLSISICASGGLRFGFCRLRFLWFWKAVAPPFTRGDRRMKPQDLQVFCKITDEDRGLLSRTSLVSADPSS